MSESKVPYKSSEVNFFEPSRDPISQERIKVLLKSYRELKKLFPPIHLAFSLFGSLAKGKSLNENSASTADVDLIVHYELNTLQKWLKENSDSEGFKLITEVSKIPLRLENNADIYYAFERLVRSVLVKNFKDSKSTYTNYNILSNIGVTYMHVNKMLNEVDITEVAPVFAAVQFGYDIGMGQRYYIHKVLTAISKKENKEDLWNKIKKASIRWHRGEDISQEVLNKIPGTFAQACRKYGLKLKNE